LLRVQGAPQHAIAATDFSPLPIDEATGAYELRSCIVTLALTDDRYLEGRWPDSPPPGIDAVRVKLIDAGDGYRKDYVAPGTVVGIKDDGTLLRTTTGGYIPKEADDDDEHKLIALAKIAAAWYTVPRRSLYLSTRRILASETLDLGDFCTTVGDPLLVGEAGLIAVNSPVSEITIRTPLADPASPASGEPVMELVTSSGELDPMQGELGSRGFRDETRRFTGGPNPFDPEALRKRAAGFTPGGGFGAPKPPPTPTEPAEPAGTKWPEFTPAGGFGAPK
jgi:hypothetical protein